MVSPGEKPIICKLLMGSKNQRGNLAMHICEYKLRGVFLERRFMSHTLRVWAVSRHVGETLEIQLGTRETPQISLLSFRQAKGTR